MPSDRYSLRWSKETQRLVKYPQVCSWLPEAHPKYWSVHAKFISNLGINTVRWSFGHITSVTPGTEAPLDALRPSLPIISLNYGRNTCIPKCISCAVDASLSANLETTEKRSNDHTTTFVPANCVFSDFQADQNVHFLYECIHCKTKALLRAQKELPWRGSRTVLFARFFQVPGREMEERIHFQAVSPVPRVKLANAAHITILNPHAENAEHPQTAESPENEQIEISPHRIPLFVGSIVFPNKQFRFPRRQIF